MNVKLTKTQKIRLTSSADIYKIMQQVLLRENKIDRNKEHFWTIGLDNANRILYIELVSLGDTTSAPAEPMQIYRVAILKGAVQMVLVHNHPSNEVKASREDRNITDRLIQVGNIIGIKVIDHLIIGEQTFNSFNDTGELEKIEESTLYMPSYKLQAQIKREAKAIGIEEGKQLEQKKMIKLLIEKKYTIKQIMELTGISKAQAEKLKITNVKSNKK
jgi:DNA repair protein RadC